MGGHFDVVFASENRVLHPGISRDRQWLCTDMLVPCEDGKVRWAVVLIHAATGESEILAFAPAIAPRAWITCTPPSTGGG